MAHGHEKSSGAEDDEFKQLIEQCEEHNVALSTSHVVELLRIKDPEWRLRVQTKAAKDRWSVVTLREEIESLFATAA